jgi:hypothetical protein
MSLIIFCLLPIHSVDFALRSSAKVRGTQRQWCSDHGRSETARDPSGSQIGIPASARRRASSWSPAFGIWSLCKSRSVCNSSVLSWIEKSAMLRCVTIMPGGICRLSGSSYVPSPRSEAFRSPSRVPGRPFFPANSIDASVVRRRGLVITTAGTTVETGSHGRCRFVNRLEVHSDGPWSRLANHASVGDEKQSRRASTAWSLA